MTRARGPLHRVSVRALIAGGAATLVTIMVLATAGLLLVTSRMRAALEREASTLLAEQQIVDRINRDVARQLLYAASYLDDPRPETLADFRELTDIKIKAGTTGLLMIGGGVPKNFTQDTVVCAEILGHEDVEVHKYAVQITVADVRDGACSSSTLQEAASWGKVSTAMEQMVFAEATSVLPLLASDAWHRGAWRNREKRRFAKLFD